MSSSEDFKCPHCGGKLSKTTMPMESLWSLGYLMICFNDECSYYVAGWDVLMSTRKVKASYRYRIDPATGAAGPFAVWSEDAMKDKIVKE